jgi:hypothetical protein
LHDIQKASKVASNTVGAESTKIIKWNIHLLFKYLIQWRIVQIRGATQWFRILFTEIYCKPTAPQRVPQLKETVSQDFRPSFFFINQTHFGHW